MAKLAHNELNPNEMADCESLMRQSNRFLRVHQSLLPRQMNRDLLAGHVMRTEGDTIVDGHVIPASHGDVIRESGCRRVRVFGQFGDMLANLANKFACGGSRRQYCKEERFEEYYQEAVMGINSAYFYYTDPGVKFITFGHTSVERRLIRYSKGLPLDPVGLIRNVKSSVRIISEIGRDEENPTDIAAPATDFSELDLSSLREAIRLTEFTPLERIAYEGFVRYSGERGWARKVAAETMNPETDKPYTLAAINLSWDRLQSKLKAKMS